MPITEVVTLPLLPGSEGPKPGGLGPVPMGQIRSAAGMQIEHPHILEGVIVWDSVDANDAFIQSPDYKTTMAPVHSLRDPKVTVGLQHYHFDSLQNLKEATTAPVTEVARFYYDSQPTAELLSGFTEFGRRVMKENVPGVSGAAAALPDEDVGYDFGESQVIIFMIGWESIKCHENFKKTQLFTDLLPLLKSDKATKIEMHHTAFIS
ncbi:hypothetical protein LTR86_008818 [Recurvomyces mirabilis]|nr:hypothetical protein LTR86_008818 [Recurvomyces mirabilis]